ncbi:MAG: chromosomal replication initiator protein DnaA [Candidatus Firestonebacteria bacterium]|nr:chromosomal replication initiator protein DnaA [Candidatus Firestonebacteria bacterium]
MTDVSLWNRTLEIVKTRVSNQSYETWFKVAKAVAYDEATTTLTLEVPNTFNKEWLEKNYKELLLDILKSVENRDIFINYSISTSKQEPVVVETANISPREEKKFSSGTIVGLSLDQKNVFENFIVGDSNRFAHGACVAVSEAPAKSYNPVFIYGGVGLGKTHLLHAIGNAVRKGDPSLKIAYLTSEQFLNEMVSAIASGKINDFRNKYRYVDLLMIDDIQFLQGKEGMQEEFFHTFNVLYSANRQIVATSDSKPQELKIEERLKSRFEMGLIADIGAPSLELRVAILKRKAEGEKIFLTDEICLFIANMESGDIRKLGGYLTKVMAYSSITKTKISLELVKECLRDVIPSAQEKKVTIEDIKDAVVKYYKLRPSDMVTKKRTQPAAFARQVAMYLTREHTDMSLPEIGQNFGGRDHSTVIHAYEAISSKLQTDLILIQELKEIQELMKSS